MTTRVNGKAGQTNSQGGADPGWSANLATKYDFAGYLHCQYMPEWVVDVVDIPGYGLVKYPRPTGNLILDCQTTT